MRRARFPTAAAATTGARSWPTAPSKAIALASGLVAHDDDRSLGMRDERRSFSLDFFRPTCKAMLDHGCMSDGPNARKLQQGWAPANEFPLIA